ncbi:MAG: hypothetical protein ACXV7H_08290 [Methylobacter sp.]
MQDQSAQTPIFNIGRVTVSSIEDAIRLLNTVKQDQPLLIDQCCKAIQYFKNIGDACRHPAHIPEVSGQGGNQ